MSLSCLHATDPKITNVIRLYDDQSNDGHLWVGSGALPNCSSTSPPRRSRCEVCLQRFVYAVCSNLLQTAKLVMEGPGQPIDILESNCPGLLGDDTLEWWQIFLPILLIIIIAALVVSHIWKKYRKTSECLTKVEEEEAVQRVGEEEAIHRKQPEMERDAEAAV